MQNVDSNSRYDNFSGGAPADYDSRKLVTLEKYLGQSYSGLYANNPRIYQADENNFSVNDEIFCGTYLQKVANQE